MLNWKPLVLIAGVIGFAFLQASADPRAPRKKIRNPALRTALRAQRRTEAPSTIRWPDGRSSKPSIPGAGRPAVAKGECTQSMINDGRFLKF